MMLIPVMVATVSAVVLAVFLWAAPKLQLIDRPNDRSLHQRPTVVGAGVAPVIGILSGWGLSPGLPQYLNDWLFGVTLLLLAVGLADDRFKLPSLPRLACYTLAVIFMLTVGWPASIGIELLVLLVIGFVWLINLFNFMDGADGFAGLQCVMVAAAMGLLAAWMAMPAVALMWAIVLAAMLPFMLLNWPPAKCFLGDAGSVPLGWLLGVAGWVSALQAPALGWAWLILMMPFLVDASATLLLRLAQGYSPLAPHRQHAYQRATRLAGSPLPVDLGLAAMHLVWQFPLAMTVVATPLFNPIAVIFSAIPTALLLVYLNRAE